MDKVQSQAIRKINQNKMALQNSMDGPRLKTFVLDNMDSKQSTIFQGKVELRGDEVDLGSILAEHLSHPVSKLQIYDPQGNSFLALKPNSQKVNVSLLQPTFILLRYSDKPYPHRKGSSREDRSKERTIGEAIDLVREWRAMHETWAGGPKNRKKVSLPEAASMLGVPKKTLDDYYCQLRIAEQHGFDFQAHMHEGVGVLRAFVKSRREKVGKHPKVLRVIEDLSFLAKEHSTEGPSQSQQQKPIEEKGQQVKQGSEASGIFTSGINNTRQIQVLQQDFYRGFEYLLDDPIDPFMNLNRIFSVRFSDDDSNDILFY